MIAFNTTSAGSARPRTPSHPEADARPTVSRSMSNSSHGEPSAAKASEADAEQDASVAGITVTDLRYLSASTPTRRPLAARGSIEDSIVLRPSPSYSEAETSFFSENSHADSHTPSTATSTRRLLFPGLLKRSQGSHSDTTSVLSRWRKSKGEAAPAMSAESLKMSLLGYEPTLFRDHDAWSLIGLTSCNLGSLPGGIYAAVRVTRDRAGSAD